MVAAAKKAPKKAKPRKEKPKAAKPQKQKPTKQERQHFETEKVSELIEQQRVLNAATQEFNAAHAEAGAAKKEMEKQQGILNGIVTDLTNIRTGNYTPGLPFKGEQGQPAKKSKVKLDDHPDVGPIATTVDEGAQMPLSLLAGFGMTPAKLEIVASAAEGNTIGALEKFMRADIYWNRKCKGLGEEWCAKLTDALAEFRKKHPMPDPVRTESEKAAAAKKSEPATEATKEAAPESAPVAKV